MPAIKKQTVVTPKQSMPAKFLAVSKNGYVINKPVSETAAIAAATKACQPARYNSSNDVVGIYRLIKVVRRKVAPVEVEEVACCE